MAGNVRVGTCSWSDKTMIADYYPRDVRTPEARLRYYAARFDTVEVDSTFYGLPRRDWVEGWAERTPPGFVFHVKAYGLMTQHAVDERSLPPELRDMRYELTRNGKATRPEPRMLERAFELFRAEIEPLREAGKMGGVLMQFPPHFTATTEENHAANLAYLQFAAEMLDDLPVLVEFRHPSWVTEERAGETFAYLADRGLTYVCVDSPQFDRPVTMPTVCAATAPVGYVRLHGRNTDTFFKKTETAAERFDYLYSREELLQWEAPIRELASQTEVTCVMFNNCRSDYAPRNAREMAGILCDLTEERPGGVPTGEPVSAGGDASEGEQLDLGV